MAEIKKRGKRAKLVKRIVVIAVVVAIVLTFLLVQGQRAKGRENATSLYIGDIYTVARRDVEDTVSATGLVESNEDTTAKVYSTLSYKIADVLVSLGDTVEAGNLLCSYDTETLDRAIREKELSMTTSQRSATLNLANAKLTYESFLDGINKGTNATINNANSSYETALQNFEKAQKDYDTYANELAEGVNTQLSTSKRALDNAEKQYEDLKEEIESGTNLKLNSAKRSMDTAKENYEDYQKKVNNDETAELLSASANSDAAFDSYKNARNELAQLKKTLETYKSQLAEEEGKPDDEQDAEKISSLKSSIRNTESKISAQNDIVDKLLDAYYVADDAYEAALDAADMSLKSYKTTYENAKENYDSVLQSLNDTLDSYYKAYCDAKDSYTSVKKNADMQLSTYNDAMIKAQRALDDATLALENAKITANNQLEGYRISYENAKNSANTALADFQLAGLYNDLEKAKVTAPISGTVTAVYAVEGESISGVMFVIEDTSDLVVTSTVKAYDLDKVEAGMRVNIETDASGDKVYTGIIESIAPTAAKDSYGSVVSTNDAAFDTVIRVEDEDERLKIGVSARIEYVIADAMDACVVPKSAVVFEQEKAFVLIVGEADEEQKVTLSKKEITMGVTDGIYTEVIGIDEGEKVVDNAENYLGLLGTAITLSDIPSMSFGGISFGNMGMMGPMAMPGK